MTAYATAYVTEYVTAYVTVYVHVYVTVYVTYLLSGAYDKSKKKHSLSLKKLEAQISTLVNQYEVPVPSSRESAYTANDPGLTNRLTVNRK